MSTKNETISVDILTQYISRGIELELKDKFDLVLEKLTKDLNTQKNEICAGILLNVMKMVSAQQMGETMVFTVREITPNKP